MEFTLVDAEPPHLPGSFQEVCPNVVGQLTSQRLDLFCVIIEIKKVQVTCALQSDVTLTNYAKQKIFRVAPCHNIAKFDHVQVWHPSPAPLR